THEYVVGDPYRQFFAGQRVLDEQPGGLALFFLGGDISFGYTAALAFIDEGLQRRIVLCGLGGQWMLGGDRDIGRAHQGVGASGEDLELAGAADRSLIVGE